MVEWAWQGQIEGLGESDCEAIASGYLAQPVNATTSLAYVAAGLTLIVKALREETSDRTGELIYGTTLVAVGFGSMAFHGPQPDGSQFYHDVPITAALLFIFLANLRRLDRLQRTNLRFFLTLLPIAALHAVAPTLGQFIAAALAGGAIVTQVLVYRSERSRTGRRLDVTAAAFLVAAGLGYFFGRTNSIFCEPDSVWQAHGLWHVLSAAAFMVWGFATSKRNRESTTPTEAHA